LGLKVFSERFLLKDSILNDSFLKDSILKDSGFVEKSDSERFHSERFRAPIISSQKKAHCFCKCEVNSIYKVTSVRIVEIEEAPPPLEEDGGDLG
jgi:hypothetical protein